MSTHRNYSDLAVFRRLLREARPYLPHAVLLFLISVLAAPVALLLPLPLKIAVDNVIGDQPLPAWLAAILPAGVESSTTALLIAVALMLVVITLLGEVRTLTESVFGASTGERLLLAFRTKLFRQGQRLSLAYHDTVGTADAAYRIQYDSWAIRTILLSGVTPLVTAVVTLVSMFYIVSRLDAQLALIALAVAPFMFGLTWISRTRLRKGWREAKTVESSSLSVIQEAFMSLRVVKAFGREDHEEGRFAGRAQKSLDLRVRLALYAGWIGLLLSVVTAVGTGLVLFVGVLHVEEGALTLGSLLLILGYLSALYAPLRMIARQVGSLQAAFASGERALSLLDEQPDVPERPHARHLGRASGDFELRDVSFGYGGGPDVLRAVSFAVPAGSRVGIAGVTGAGKSTLVSLLCRFYDPRAGQILLDGVDIADFKVVDLRDQYGIVLQEPALFSTTIAENIAYSRPDAAFDEIVAAAQIANAHEFISELPDGYDAPVGERGMTLSGGERQRISLARAFLKDAPILILDEPTSSVDAGTEAGIIEAMERLMAGRTTFMIAHRLSTIEGCDVRLTVANGTVTVEQRDVAANHGSIANTKEADLGAGVHAPAVIDTPMLSH